MKIKQFLFLFFIATQCATAQNPYSSSLEPTKGILPPSPTAAGLATYGEIPVGLHTGVPKVSIPLTGIKGRSLSLPISLSYHSAGHQVDAISSWVGLGWSLNAGGVVTRTVKGLEDDKSGTGYWNQPIRADLFTGGNPVTAQQAQDINNYYHYLNNVASKRWDSQPDQFNFNFNGYSGRFLIENDGGTLIPHLIPHQNIKIDLQFESGKLSSLLFTTPDGVQYTFGALCENGIKAVEKSRTNPVGVQCGHNYSLPVITSWYLTSITAPNSIDKITFNYNQHNINYSTTVTEKATKKERAAGCRCCGEVEPGTLNPAGRWDHLRCEQTLILNGVHLVSIKSASQRVVFQSDNQRDDLFGGRKLTNILYYGAEGSLFKSINLTQDYHETTGLHVSSHPALNKRLRLTEVTEKDANGQANPAYQLEYNPLELPPRLSNAKDFWGFFNGKHNNTSLIPSELPTDPLFYEHGGDRYPNAIFAAAGILTKVIYPTGGSSEVEYEAHELAYDIPIPELVKRTLGVLAEYDYPNVGANTKQGIFTLGHDQEVNIRYKVYNKCGTIAPLVSYLKIEQKIGGSWEPLTTTNSNISQSTTPINANDGKGTVRFGGIHPTVAIENLYEDEFKLDLIAGDYRLTAAALNSCLDPNGGSDLLDKLDISVQYVTETGNLIYNEEIGGLRVKKTTLYDGLDHSKDVIKEYDYQKKSDNSTSSGYAPRPSDYYQRNVTTFPVYSDVLNLNCRLQPIISIGFVDFPRCICEQTINQLLSESQIPLHGTNGSHIAYREVTVLDGTNGANGKTWNRFSEGQNTSANGGEGLIVPQSLLDWRGGYLREKITYKNANGSFVKLQSIKNDYQTSSTTGDGLGIFNAIAVNLQGHQRDWINADNVYSSCDGQNINSGTTLGDGSYWPHPCNGYANGDYVIDWEIFNRFNYVAYPIYYGWEKLIKTTIRQYDESGIDYIETITENEYDDTYTHVKVKTTTNSDGTIYSTKLKYPTDYDTYVNQPDERAKAINALKNQHRHNVAIESTKYIQKVGQTEQFLGGMFTSFETNPNGLVVPKAIYRTELGSPIPRNLFTETDVNPQTGFSYDSNIYRKYGTYTGHNEVGKTLGFEKEGDITSSYVWDYDNRVPTLSATNAHHSELGYTSFEKGDETNWNINATNSSISGKIGNWALQTTEQFPFGRVFEVDGQSKKYKFSAWVKTSDATYSYLVLSTSATPNGTIFPATNIAPSYVQTGFTTTSGEWQLVEVEIDLEEIRQAAGLSTSQILSINAYLWNPYEKTIALDAVRFHPSAAFVQAYDYDGNTLQPVTMEDVNRLHSTYFYDDFQRLSYVKDFEGNILTANEYHYKGNSGVENYVKTKVLRVEGKTTLADLIGLPLDQLTESYQYLDGLGRSIQSVGKGQSPSQKDVISFNEYDIYGRQARAYLPFVNSNSNTGSFIANPIALAQNFYSNEIADESQSTYPFSETLFEASPMNRPKEQSSPGAGWQIGNNHTTRNEYGHNGVNEVLQLNGQGISAQYYPAKSLFKSEVTNTKGVKSISYTDKLGRAILVKQQVSPTTWTNTYTLYNDFGKVEAVITPLAVEMMYQIGNYDYTNSAYKELIYTYIYDARQRLKRKKIPNAGVVYHVYDQLDRIVATQDANQRLLGQWIIQKYDEYGRPILSALYHTNLDQKFLQDYYNQQTVFFERPATNSIGYTNTIPVLTTNDPIQNINYYDDYDFDNDGQIDANNTFIVDGVYSSSYFERTLGQVTGSKVRLLDVSNRFLKQVSFYDERGRVIQTQNENHLNGQDISFSAYDFVGNLTQMKYKHTTSQNHVNNEVITEEFFDYDHTGRLQNVYHKIGNQDKILLSQLNYDELGRLIEKNLHSTNGGDNFLQSIDYHYNVKNWLVRINDLYRASPVSIDPDPGSPSLLQKRINQIVLKYNSQDVANGEVETEIKIDDETVDLVNGIIVASQQTQTEVDLYGEGYSTTNKDGEVQVDFSDRTVTENNIGASLEELEARLQQKLTQNGVTNPVVMEVLLKDLKAEYRDRWLLLRSSAGNEDNEDLFSMNFDYDYGGNIHHLEWKVASYDYRSIYDYNYDNLDRLSNANYKEYLESSTPIFPVYQHQDNFSVNNITYDIMGNIMQLQRRGTVNASGTSLMNGLIDNLNYTYNGNQLTAIQDAADANNGFVDGASGSQEYIYDLNGNMIRDDNKHILSSYNHMNLPKQITFSQANARIDWLYTANGHKVQKKVTDASNVVTYKHYIGNVQYVNTELDFIQHSEGRIIRNLVGIDPSNNPIYDYRYEYSLKDHLGNGRVFFSDMDKNGIVEVAQNGNQNELLQQEHYYPFGSSIKGEWKFVQPQIGGTNLYQFNGIELNDDYGLNWNMAFYRSYDPNIGRWMQIDPLAEKYLTMSSYNGMGNNPISYSDPQGDSIPTKFLGRGGRELKHIPRKVQRMYNEEYGIKVGYNAKTQMLYKTGDVVTTHWRAEGAKEILEAVLGEHNSSVSQVFGYNLSFSGTSIVGGRHFNDDMGDVTLVDLADFGADLHHKGLLKFARRKKEFSPNFNRTFNMARVYEHEFIAHGIENRVDGYGEQSAHNRINNLSRGPLMLPILENFNKSLTSVAVYRKTMGTKYRPFFLNPKWTKGAGPRAGQYFKTSGQFMQFSNGTRLLKAGPAFKSLSKNGTSISLDFLLKF